MFSFAESTPYETSLSIRVCLTIITSAVRMTYEARLQPLLPDATELVCDFNHGRSRRHNLRSLLKWGLER